MNKWSFRVFQPPTVKTPTHTHPLSIPNWGARYHKAETSYPYYVLSEFLTICDHNKVFFNATMMVYYAAIINWYTWDPENDSIFSVIYVIYIFKTKITFSELREFFTWTLDSMLLWLCVKRLQRIFGIMSIMWEKVPLCPFAFQILSFDHLEETIIQGLAKVFRENVLESSNCPIFTDADVTILGWHPAPTGWSTGLSIHQDHIYTTCIKLFWIWIYDLIPRTGNKKVAFSFSKEQSGRIPIKFSKHS